MLSRWPVGARVFTTTTRRRDKGVIEKLTQLINQGEANRKPMDAGTAIILGAPACICFGMYIWKQDRDHLEPIREKNREKQTLIARESTD